MANDRCPQLLADHAALKAALTQLALGTKLVKVAYDGRNAEYTPAQESTLRSLIQEVEEELAKCNCSAEFERRRPIRPVFGRPQRY
ncbi:MAG: gpW family head-tail joining protein [Henriciella sp.]|nr:gpW family head-tail joining protein [Henriciella sp.]